MQVIWGEVKANSENRNVCGVDEGAIRRSSFTITNAFKQPALRRQEDAFRLVLYILDPAAGESETRGGDGLNQDRHAKDHRVSDVAAVALSAGELA
jgi:hypothetical protein